MQGGLGFIYDMADQPRSVSGTNRTGGTVSGGTYAYDGNMKRVRSVIDGRTIYNVYDSTGQLVHVDEGDDPATPAFDPKETDYLHGMGQTLARIENDVFTYLHPDHLGSPQAGTKGQGNPLLEIGDVAWNEHYTPFGEALISNAANDNQGGFTGHIKDKATGLNYMQARYYDPNIGRFLSPDPVTFLEKSYPGQFNRYAYTWNDPINANDPDGEFLNFVAKFAVDVALEVAIQAASGQEINLGSAVKGAAIGVLDPTKTARKVAKLGKLANTARKANKTCCFVAGTLVGTEDGLRAIENIEVGDLVWARDEKTGEEALKPVLGLIRLHDRIIWDLETLSKTGEAHSFGTTDDHPWWVDGHGWKRTDELSPNDILITQTGEKMSVSSVTNTNVIEPTFNFEVADFNTYFVGESKIWVHNANRRCGFSSSTKGEIRTKNKEAGGGVEHCVDCGVVVTRQKGPNQKGQKIASDRSEVDHDTRLADGGSNNASNGRIRCHDCHKEKTIKENSK